MPRSSRQPRVPGSTDGPRTRAVRVAYKALRDLKSALTIEGDLSTDIAFQNDVNSLLATVARLSSAGLPPPDLPRAVAREELLGSPPPPRRPRVRR